MLVCGQHSDSIHSTNIYQMLTWCQRLCPVLWGTVVGKTGQNHYICEALNSSATNRFMGGINRLYDEEKSSKDAMCWGGRFDCSQGGLGRAVWTSGEASSRKHRLV